MLAEPKPIIDQPTLSTVPTKPLPVESTYGHEGYKVLTTELIDTAKEYGLRIKFLEEDDAYEIYSEYGPEALSKILEPFVDNAGEAI